MADCQEGTSHSAIKRKRYLAPQEIRDSLEQDIDVCTDSESDESFDDSDLDHPTYDDKVTDFQ